MSNWSRAKFEPSLWVRDVEIEIRRRETGAQNTAQIVNKRKIRATETHRDPGMSRKLRNNFIQLDRAGRDRTGWLGW